MKLRSKLAVALGVMLLIAVAFLVAPENQPSYKGRSLQEWVCDYSHTGDLEAAEAIRQTGTNALPYLYKWMNYQGQDSHEPLFFRLQKPVYRLLGSELYYMDPRQVLADTCHDSLCLLAREKIVSPTLLAQMLQTSRTSLARTAAAEALVCRGEEAFPYLYAALTNTSSEVAGDVAAEIWSLGPKASLFTPPLINLLSHPNPHVVHCAGISLAHWRFQPDIVIPILTAYLTNNSLEIRVSAAFNFRDYGRMAAPAVPALLSAASSTDQRTRETAVYALEEIAPEVLANVSAAK